MTFELILKDKFKYVYEYKVLFPPKQETTQSKIIITSNNNKSKLSNVNSQDLVVITKLQTTPKKTENLEENSLETQLPQNKINEENVVTPLNKYDVRAVKLFTFIKSKF